ncbi:outer membrane protein assembly factor BamE [Neisseria sp.]|uniref:outer membrane protein assembly factor BamE domain-containing protein n=1 Tax=Neisseria sp. TaxID=192066 RepID=UPI0028A0FCC7|nr:outer membrane protein assembly factor BamE [Neisseria sp.]
MNIVRYGLWLPLLAAWGCSSHQPNILPDTAVSPGSAATVHSKRNGRALEVVEVRKPYRVRHVLQWRTVRDPKAGSKPDFARLDAVKVGLTMNEAGKLLGKPWHHGNSYLTEWNYLYRYVFAGRMQQCQYKLVFDKQNRVEGIFWEPVGQAVCRH